MAPKLTENRQVAERMRQPHRAAPVVITRYDSRWAELASLNSQPSADKTTRRQKAKRLENKTVSEDSIDFYT